MRTHAIAEPALCRHVCSGAEVSNDAFGGDTLRLFVQVSSKLELAPPVAPPQLEDVRFEGRGMRAQHVDWPGLQQLNPTCWTGELDIPLNTIGILRFCVLVHGERRDVEVAVDAGAVQQSRACFVIEPRFHPVPDHQVERHWNEVNSSLVGAVFALEPQLCRRVWLHAQVLGLAVQAGDHQAFGRARAAVE